MRTVHTLLKLHGWGKGVLKIHNNRQINMSQLGSCFIFC
jgi:hypothetical protein